jgi:hypothetical protein
VGLDGHGDAVAVWQLDTGYTFVVEAAYRPADGTWQAPVYLTPEEIQGTGGVAPVSWPVVGFSR